MSDDLIGEPFTGHHTSLDDLEAAGWSIRGNGYSWWWERRTDDGELEARVSVPYWMRQLIHRAETRGYDRGKTDVRAAFREALGVKPPRVKIKASESEFPEGDSE